MNTMKVNTRDVVIGTIFIIAIAAIFVPMLFDKPIEIDEVPDTGISQELSITEPTPEISTEDLAVTEPIVETAQIAELEEIRDSVEKRVDSEGFDSETNALLGTPTISEETAETARWAIQLASFSQELSASNFVDQIVSDGYSSWVHSTKVNDSKVHRVIVGPYTSREDANTKLNELKEKYNLQPILVDFDY